MRKVYILPLLLLSLMITSLNAVAQPGNPDPAFGSGTGLASTPVLAGNDVTFAMAVQPDGKVVIAGFADNAGVLNAAVVRYNANGTLDITFDSDGLLTFAPFTPGSDAFTAVAVQSDGKIVLAGVTGFGATQDLLVVRLDGATGTPDITFGGGDGVVTMDLNGGSIDLAAGVAIQPDGNIVVGVATTGAGGDFGVVRLLGTDGSPDPAFGGGDGIVVNDLNTASEDVPTSLALQSDGKIVMAGFTNTGGANDFTVVRYNGADGSLDGSFDGDGIFIFDINGGALEDRAISVAIDGGGNIVAAGFSNDGTGEDFAVIRLSGLDGSFDGTFNGTGIVLTDINGDDRGTGVAIQNDGKIVAGGTVSGSGDFNVARYTTAGALDITFGGGDGLASIDAGGNPDLVTGLKLTHSRIYLVGTRQVASVGDFAIAALLNDASALPLNLLSFSAQKQNNHIALQWQTEREEGITQFVVERSSDGQSFAPIGQLQPSKTNALVKNYSFTDKQPLAAVNYYRLTIKEIDETISRSKIVAIKFNKKIEDLEIYPNPVINNSLRIQLPDGLKGRINVQVMDASGRIVKATSLQPNGGSSVATTIDVTNLQKGVYYLFINNGSTIKITKPFLKN